jgi:hypothetical protein
MDPSHHMIVFLLLGGSFHRHIRDSGVNCTFSGVTCRNANGIQIPTYYFCWRIGDHSGPC